MTEATDPVRAQYEAFPYPERNPRDERRRLITGSPSHLPELTHWLFGGRLPESAPFRVLVAGGGTGDGLVMLAQQLSDAGIRAEITYLDLSEAARKIAAARLETRGLGDGVRWITGSLLEAPDLGPFDYIDCCGVLHHLPEPQAGFRALARALAPGGGLGLMVYARYGRTGVYETQAALRLLSDADEPAKRRIGLAKRYLAALPETNRLKRNPHVGDHKTGGDAGLYDLLLHSTDRAYTVAELEAEIAEAGLRRVTYIDPARYDPASYTREPDLTRRIAALDATDRAALAEAMAGNIACHTAYLVRADRPDPVSAVPSDAAIPVFRDARTAEEFAAMPDGARTMPVRLDGLTLELPLPPGAKAILAGIDGRTNCAALRERAGMADFDRRFAQLFDSLNGVSKLFLRR